MATTVPKEKEGRRATQRSYERKTSLAARVRNERTMMLIYILLKWPSVRASLTSGEAAVKLFVFQDDKRPHTRTLGTAGVSHAILATKYDLQLVVELYFHLLT